MVSFSGSFRRFLFVGLGFVSRVWGRFSGFRVPCEAVGLLLRFLSRV